MLSTGVSLPFSSTEPKICSATSIEELTSASALQESFLRILLPLVFRTFLIFSFFLLGFIMIFFAPSPPSPHQKKSKNKQTNRNKKKAKQTVNNHVKRWIWVDHESYQGLWGDHFSEMTFKGGLSIFYRGKFNFLWPTPKVKNNDYVTVVAKSAFYHSRNISRIRKYNISFHTAEI